MKKVTRRTFLSTTGVAAAAVAISACGATPTATPVPPTATKPPAPTNTPVPATAAPAAAAPTATKAPAAATAAPAAPTAAPTAAAAAKDTTSPAWLLPGSGGLPMPITKDKITLTYWGELSADKPGASMKSFGEMACYIEQEKRTDIHLEFQHAATGQAAGAVQPDHGLAQVPRHHGMELAATPTRAAAPRPSRMASSSSSTA